ncbi:GntR family transcriptional regulator [Streptomyces sp. NPDC127074]|uniref:GntR family transcriptional regulator n=1 Tax=Streptomyces sp. NPDC127074 TaxID=3347130 RepID=UPI0036579272
MPAERPREHAPPVAAARRRRLRADRARQLADLLRHQVLTGGFPGGVLPLEDALGQDYGASRNTVRQALDLLRAERLVERQPGVGTVVVAEKYPHGLDRLMGLAETLHEHGRVTNEVRTVGPVPAPACVADRLCVPARTDVLYVERLRRLGGGRASAARRLLTPLLRDPDVLVRAAALEALASAGCPAPLDAEVVAALGDAAWQVRKGAATAMSAAAPRLGVPALARALADPHADVRKAAVLALLPLAEREVGAREALSSVRADPDADVRAYAARA